MINPDILFEIILSSGSDIRLRTKNIIKYLKEIYNYEELNFNIETFIEYNINMNPDPNDVYNKLLYLKDNLYMDKNGELFLMSKGVL